MNLLHILFVLITLTNHIAVPVCYAHQSESLDSVFDSLPDNERKIISDLLDAVDSISQSSVAGRHSKRGNSKTIANPIKPALNDIRDLKPEALVAVFNSANPNHKPSRDLDQIKMILREAFETPCTNYINKVSFDAVQNCKINTELACRRLYLCRLVKSAFELDSSMIMTAAQSVSPRAKFIESPHPGLTNQLQQVADNFAQIDGAANLALLIEYLIQIQQLHPLDVKDRYKMIKLEKTDDISSSALQKAFNDIYKDAKLVRIYSYVVKPYLKIAFYEPCKNLLLLIGSNLSACHLTKHSDLACTAAITCQLIDISYKEKRKNWTDAELNLQNEAQRLKTPKDRTVSYALSRNPADNYETLVTKIIKYEKEMNRYKHL